MTNPGDAFPPGDDWIVRKLKSLQDQIDANASARSLAASSIGSGGLTVKDGGSITVEPGGDITLEDGDFVAGTITATTTVTGATVQSTGNGNVNGNVNVGGNVNTTGNGNVNLNNGTVYSVYALNNPVATGYFALYVNSDGRFGRTVSARRYKQDVTNFSPSLQAVFAMQLREYRLKQAVEELGDTAPVEYGLIAEELVDCGLEWLVQFGPDGQAEAIAYEKVALALIPVVQDHEHRLLALEHQEHT